MKVKIPSIKYKPSKKLIFFSAFIIIVILWNIFFTLRSSDKETIKYFQKAGVNCRIDYIPNSLTDYKIRVVSTGGHAKNAVLFIHGAPGSSDAFYSYLKDSTLLKNAKLITYDRPGYGYSGFGESMVKTSEQARIVKDIIDHYNLSNVVVVGHSYGGPIAAYASLLSNRINGVLMLAPAIDPDHEEYYRIGNFAKWKLTKWAVPTTLVVSADEKYAHEEDMRNLAQEWQNISVPVVSLQGDKDMLVPYENLDFTRKHFNAEYFTGKTIEKENHFIPWTKRELVVDEILGFLR